MNRLIRLLFDDDDANVKEEEEPQQQQQEKDEQKHLPNETQKEEEPAPPLNITKKFKGQERDYYYLTTVKSVEEMDQFRFKVFAHQIWLTIKLNKIYNFALELLPRYRSKIIAYFRINYYAMLK
jgi:hypothetical protein